MAEPAHPADRALTRLRSGRRQGAAAPFTGNLSIDELVLVEAAGLDPVALVVGSCVVRVTPGSTALLPTGEIHELTAAMERARARALERMTRDAARASAHGVVAVRLHLDFERWGEGLCELTAVGTAVTARDQGLRVRGRPFTCGLSGQDVHALLRAGYRPLALVMGASVWRVAPMSPGRWLRVVGRNAELAGPTEALAAARHQAMSRMTRQAARVRAAGVVGVTVGQQSHAWGSTAMEFIATGTAVAGTDGRRRRLEPRLAVALDARESHPRSVSVSLRPHAR